MGVGFVFEDELRQRADREKIDRRTEQQQPGKAK